MASLSARFDGEPQRCRARHRRAIASLVHDGDRARACSTTRRAFEYVATVAGTGDRVVAPMPGRIVLVKAKPGDKVAEGEELLVMEAMKMELTLRAPHAATHRHRVHAAAGDFVEADAVLVKLAAA